MKHLLEIWLDLLKKEPVSSRDHFTQQMMPLYSFLAENAVSPSLVATARFLEYPQRLDSYRWFQGIDRDLGLALYRIHVERLMGGDEDGAPQEFHVITTWEEFFDCVPRTYWPSEWIVTQEHFAQTYSPDSLLGKFKQRIDEFGNRARGTDEIDEDETIWVFGGFGPLVDAPYSVEGALAPKDGDMRRTMGFVHAAVRCSNRRKRREGRRKLTPAGTDRHKTTATAVPPP